MEFEIWASDSGNRIFSSPDLNEVLDWALDYWVREGDGAMAEEPGVGSVNQELAH